MRTNWLITVPAIGVAALYPGVLSAARARPCTVAPAAAESYMWNFPGGASNLLKGIRFEAQQVVYQAAQLRYDSTTTDTGFYGAEAQGLTRIKADIDDMGRQLCRLEEIRGVTAPWEQQTIDRVAPLVHYLADHTNDALRYMNAPAHSDSVNQGEYWRPSYKIGVDRLSSEAHAIAHEIHRSEKFAKQLNRQMYFGSNPPPA
jgi:hypothetical protein